MRKRVQYGVEHFGAPPHLRCARRFTPCHAQQKFFLDAAGRTCSVARWRGCVSTLRSAPKGADRLSTVVQPSWLPPVSLSARPGGRGAILTNQLRQQQRFGDEYE